jgi:uncharacterized membrane protein
LKSGAAVVVVMLIVPVAGTEVLNHPFAANIAETLASTINTTMIVTIIGFFIFLTCPFYFLPRPKEINIVLLSTHSRNRGIVLSPNQKRRRYLNHHT